MSGIKNYRDGKCCPSDPVKQKAKDITMSAKSSKKAGMKLNPGFNNAR